MKDNSVLVVNGKTMKLPKVYFQFKALRAAWMKSSSPMKDTMIEMLTQSMQEVVDNYNVEQEMLKEIA